MAFAMCKALRWMRGKISRAVPVVVLHGSFRQLWTARYVGGRGSTVAWKACPVVRRSYWLVKVGKLVEAESSLRGALRVLSVR